MLCTQVIYISLIRPVVRWMLGEAMLLVLHDVTKLKEVMIRTNNFEIRVGCPTLTGTTKHLDQQKAEGDVSGGQ